MSCSSATCITLSDYFQLLMCDLQSAFGAVREKLLFSKQQITEALQVVTKLLAGHKVAGWVVKNSVLQMRLVVTGVVLWLMWRKVATPLGGWAKGMWKKESSSPLAKRSPPTSSPPLVATARVSTTSESSPVRATPEVHVSSLALSPPPSADASARQRSSSNCSPHSMSPINEVSSPPVVKPQRSFDVLYQSFVEEAVEETASRRGSSEPTTGAEDTERGSK